ncbi:MAG: TIGR04150 pseudo-rSAM protein [Bacteroidales bacterium]|jgi:pseudo-rSAM protein|nr:TIGR04150 pseudo-rSAM protein [Bacteroidales bacterium]
MIENKDKKQWIAIENWIYAVIRPNQLLLYNTRTGQYMISQESEHVSIVAKMHEKKNLGVILFEEDWFENQKILSFIEEAVEKNIFTLEDYREDGLKPIRLMPVLNIQKDVERMKRNPDRSAGESSLSYLTELSLYVNDSCPLHCKHCGQLNKQFMCCGRDKDDFSLDAGVLAKIAAQIKYAPIMKLNILGGDIFSYPLLDKIPEIFSDKKEQLHFWSHYKNFQAPNFDAVWEIVVDLPVDEQVLSYCVSESIKQKTQYNYHFIIQNEEEVNLVEKIINKLDIQTFEMHPCYSGENIDFFESCIFLNKEDIFGDTISQRRIFCNQALNSNFFGSLTVFSNGDVAAQVNVPVLGNISTDSLLELITRELEQNTAWRKVRNVPPCNDCLFQYLCPPVSSYEAVFKRENLCALY